MPFYGRSSQRPDRFRLNTGHSLHTRLVYAGLGQGLTSGTYRDDSVSRCDGQLINFIGTGNSLAERVAWNSFVGRWTVSYGFNTAGASAAINFPLDATGPFTLAGWLWVPSWPFDAYLWGVYQAGSPMLGVHIRSNAGKVVVCKQSDSSQLNNYGQPAVKTWHHIAYVRQGTNNRLYVNGSNVHTSLTAIDTATAITGIAVAANPDTGLSDPPASGTLIVDPMVWTRVLAKEELIALADPTNANYRLAGYPLIIPVRRYWPSLPIAGSAVPQLGATGSASEDGSADLVVISQLGATGDTTEDGSVAIEFDNQLEAAGDSIEDGSASLTLIVQLGATGSTTESGLTLIRLAGGTINPYFGAGYATGFYGPYFGVEEGTPQLAAIGLEIEDGSAEIAVATDTLAATGLETEDGSAALIPIVLLAATGLETEDGSVTFSGTTVQLAATGAETEDGSSTLNFIRQLAATGAATETGQAEFESLVPQLTVTGLETEGGSATLTTISQITATGQETETGSVAILTVPTAVVVTGSAIETGSVGVILVRQLTATGAATEDGLTRLAPMLDLTATGAETETGTAAGLPIVQVAATGAETESGTADLRTMSILAATGSATETGTIGLTLISRLAATATETESSSLTNIIPPPQLAAVGLATESGVADFNAGKLAATGQTILDGSAAVTAIRQFAATDIESETGSVGVNRVRVLDATSSTTESGSLRINPVPLLGAGPDLGTVLVGRIAIEIVPQFDAIGEMIESGVIETPESFLTLRPLLGFAEEDGAVDLSALINLAAWGTAIEAALCQFSYADVAMVARDDVILEVMAGMLRDEHYFDIIRVGSRPDDDPVGSRGDYAACWIWWEEGDEEPTDLIGGNSQVLYDRTVQFGLAVELRMQDGLQRLRRWARIESGFRNLLTGNTIAGLVRPGSLGFDRSLRQARVVPPADRYATTGHFTYTIPRDDRSLIVTENY